MRPGSRFAEAVVGLVALVDQAIRDQPAMAAPGHRLGTHVGDASTLCDRQQLGQAGRKVLGRHVLRVVADAGFAPFPVLGLAHGAS